MSVNPLARRNLRLLTILTLLCIAAIVTPRTSLAQTNESSCTQYQTYAVGGGYTVQNDFYNPQNGGTQCIYANSNGTNWYETSTNTVSGGTPGGYPSIYAGCHWGNCSANQEGMPILVSQIGTAPSTWYTTLAPNGAYDVSYDIWFNTTPTTGGAPNGLELMVWLNEAGANPAGGEVASNVSINGINWNVYYAANGGSGTPLLSYEATNKQTGVNFDLNYFFKDAVSRGYLENAWYLIDIEAGTEIFTPGSNFTTNSFCALASTSAPLAAPTGLTAGADSSSEISLSWNASSGAASYDVYRSTSNGFQASGANQIATNVTGATYNDTGLQAGTTYYYLVAAVNCANSGVSNQASATTASGGGGGGSFPAPTYQIAAGSTAGGGGNISPFVGDEFVSGGIADLHANTINTSYVVDPAPQAVYQYERYGTSAFTYTIPNLTAGASYWVRLHFAEIYFTAAGQREFDVSINGTQVLTNFDIVATAGAANTAVIEMFEANANGSGQITITFNLGAVNYPKVDGIEIIPVATPKYQVAAGSSAGGGGSISPYASDEFYSGGTADLHNVTVSTGNVANAAPEAVYQYERYGTAAFTYTIPNLTAGSNYAVRLHFAETYFTAAGDREFNVVINGTQVLTNFDIVAAAGGANAAVTRSFTATANGSGQITLTFSPGAVNYPKIDGIEVVPQ